MIKINGSRNERGKPRALGNFRKRPVGDRGRGREVTQVSLSYLQLGLV